MARPNFSPAETAQLEMHKKMMRGAVASAAPGLVLLVVASSVRTLTLLSSVGLGALGLSSLGVVFFCLAYLFKRGHWWAGLPAFLAALGGMAYFIKAFVRPLILYFQANPVQGLGDILEPMFFMSVPLVGVSLCFTLAFTMWQALKLARSLEPMHVGRTAYIALGVWLAFAAADYGYQNWLWASWGSPQDYVYRLCYGGEGQRDVARRELLKLGPKAAPVLVEALSLPPERQDPDADCLRESSREILAALGRDAEPTLHEAAENGNAAAVRFLKERGPR